jgi:rubrerythrin
MIIGVDKAQKDGHWIIVGCEQVIPGVPYLEKKCSSCGFTHSLVIPDDYCPKCGSHNAGNYKPSIKEFFNDNRRR